MSEMNTKDVIQSKFKRGKRSLDEDERKEKFAEEKRKKIISKVNDDVDSMGEDFTTIQGNLTASDATLGKVQEFLI